MLDDADGGPFLSYKDLGITEGEQLMGLKTAYNIAVSFAKTGIEFVTTRFTLPGTRILEERYYWLNTDPYWPMPQITDDQFPDYLDQPALISRYFKPLNISELQRLRLVAAGHTRTSLTSQDFAKIDKVAKTNREDAVVRDIYPPTPESFKGISVKAVRSKLQAAQQAARIPDRRRRPLPEPSQPIPDNLVFPNNDSTVVIPYASALAELSTFLGRYGTQGVLDNSRRIPICQIMRPISIGTIEAYNDGIAIAELGYPEFPGTPGYVKERSSVLQGEQFGAMAIIRNALIYF